MLEVFRGKSCAMAQDHGEERRKRHKEIALEPPKIPLLSDEPLTPEDAWRDSFDLDKRLGSVYDMLRHPATQTPLTVAIYGDWGAGKTSAMRWLDSLLGVWNEDGKPPEGQEKIRVRRVWFFPWKYYTKQDVWAGLLAEVILNSIGPEKATLATVRKLAKRFGPFLGWAFLHALAGLPAMVGILGGLKARVVLSSAKKILAKWREAGHPEKAYLNEFEDALHQWVKNTLGSNERMVVFIDDLDRCMPEVALEVLEALKLYLNIEGLIFVVGLDPRLVSLAVESHYRRLGIWPDKGAQPDSESTPAGSGPGEIGPKYLAKMFQVEVSLAPTEEQIERFLDEQLEGFLAWKEQLSDEEREVFRSVLRELAGLNPREVKRLVNGAMAAGASLASAGASRS